MPLTMPPRRRDATEPRVMVRVQLKPNDIRSYERSDADVILAANPGAFIIGDPGEDDEGAEVAESAAPRRSSAASRRAAGSQAPNKARTTKPAETKPTETTTTTPPGAGAGTEPPGAGAETKNE